MPFVHELLNYRSVAVVGMEKNCGKTECLNYIIRRMPLHERKVCSGHKDSQTGDSAPRGYVLLHIRDPLQGPQDGVRTGGCIR